MNLFTLYRFRMFPLLILVVGFGMTWLVWSNSRHRELSTLREDFDLTANKMEHAMESRFQSNVQVLRGAAGLFAASDQVTRREFQRYVDSLRLEERYPGIQGVGFSQMVPSRDKGRHERRIRDEGFPEYAIRPRGERELYSSVVYLEPFRGRNLRAFGYDMYSEPVRRAAMSRARDEGEAALSGKVTLEQETETDVQAGFLLYVPIYRGTPHSTREQRRSALVGWVYSPLRVTDLMRNLLCREMPETGSLVDLQLYDGTRAAPEALMFDSDGEQGPKGPRFEVLRQIRVAGHLWTIRISSLPGFEARLSSERDAIIIGTGVSLSGLLALLTVVLVRNRERIAWALELSDQANKELAVSEERFRSYFELGLIGMAICSPEKRWLQVNDRLCEMFGYSREELLQSSWSELTHPDDLEESLIQVQRILDGEVDGYHLDKRYIRKDARTLYASLSLKCLRGAGGSATQIVVLLEEITTRKEMEEQLLEYSTNLENLVYLRTCELEEANRELEIRRDQAEAANRAKSMFLATMSHELRTPLNAILGLSESLREGILGELNERQRRGVTTIEESGHHLLTLITDILDLSKIEADRMELLLAPVELDELCRASLRFVGEVAHRRQIPVTYTLQRAPEMIRTDQRRLKQILINLLGNAVKFTPDGGRIGLEVSSDEVQGEVMFAVWDTGIGIATDDLPQLFQPFVQVDSCLARRYEGTGLGLTLVVRLTEFLGGRVAVVSTVGSGSRFTITLPFDGPAISAEPAPTDSRVESGDCPHEGPYGSATAE